MARDKQSGGAWPKGTGSRNSGSGATKNGSKLVSYCPECPAGNQFHGNPISHPHASVQWGQMTASCHNGHTWALRF